VSDQPTIQELEAHKDELLAALSLSARIKAETVPDALAHADLSAICERLDTTFKARLAFGDEPELTEFLSDFVMRSEEGLRECLLSDIDLFERAVATGEDQVHHTAFGMLEGVFPVKIAGTVVHGLRTGRLRDRPITDEEIAGIAEVSGASPATVRSATQAIPIMDRAQLDATIALFRATRDSIEQSIEDRARCGQMSHQLVQSERTRSLGTLSGGIAHHFNNLLSVILGYSSYVLNRQEHGKEISEALHKIAEAAQRGRRLTEEVLAFAESDREEDELCHVHEILANVLSLMESEMSSQTRVEKNFAAARDEVLSLPSAVHQTVFNLVTNGLDSMAGSGVLAVDTSNVTLGVGAEQCDYLKLTVTDSGGMVPEEFLDGDQTARKLPQGNRMALRLSSVYGMVSRMEGTLTVSSEPGEHTRVEVLIPLAADDQVVPETKLTRRRLAPSIIWVIDDDEIFREMCRQVLAEEGHEVLAITGGKELQKVWTDKEAPPELIIMDFSMPEYNGLELCEWLRDQGSRVPVVLVSGFTDKQPDIRKALKMRKTYFLQKPFTSRDLTDSVTVAMGETLIGDTAPA
jgi:signal transduction histidine kinase/ActR/RegA family two-component response regulator